MIQLRDLVTRVARSKAHTVLIYGETGTGKGVVARMIHEQSHRASAAFVDINCAAIPSALLESELFGHEKGAFTGAGARKQGLLEAADGGTFFLDEVRELDPVMQAKILTLLDTRRMRRVGGVQALEVDVRFIAATNKILLGEVKTGHFRDDLYYRLQVIAINIPPLRERGEDVFLLADECLVKLNRLHGSRITQIDEQVKEVFRRYSWPGNVRELENLLERICLLEDGDCIHLAHLPSRILREIESPGKQAAHLTGDHPGQQLGDFHSATQDFQRSLIEHSLLATGNNIGASATHLGLSRHALRHQMIKLGMMPKQAWK